MAHRTASIFVPKTAMADPNAICLISQEPCLYLKVVTPFSRKQPAAKAALEMAEDRGK